MGHLSDASREALQQLLARHGAAAGTLLPELAAQARELRLGKGQALLNAGDRAVTAGLVVDGLLGEFYLLEDGTRKSKWLARAGDVFGSLEDLVRDAPARATIEALTPCKVLCLPYAQLRELAASQPAWSAFFIALIEDLYRQKSEREYALLMLRAEDRYRWFVARFGGIEQQVSQEIVASYLGITPVHLSRIRRQGRAR